MIEIVTYEPQYARAFHDLNKEWITTFFEMEAEDYKYLENPETYIINQGGYIFIALFDKNPVGACALVKHGNNEYELSKMAVSPKAQGQKIGQLLAEKIIATAKDLGITKLYLITNSILKPAIALYEKLGFKHVQNFTSVYARGDVKMELLL